MKNMALRFSIFRPSSNRCTSKPTQTHELRFRILTAHELNRSFLTSNVGRTAGKVGEFCLRLGTLGDFRFWWVPTQISLQIHGWRLK